MRPLAVALAALVLAASGEQIAELPKAPGPAGPGMANKAQPLPLNPAGSNQDRVEDFFYAGGLKLTSAQSSRLHGLSDLDVQPDGLLISVGDESDLLKAKRRPSFLPDFRRQFFEVPAHAPARVRLEAAIREMT